MEKYLDKSGHVWTRLDIARTGLKCHGEVRTMLHHNSRQQKDKKIVIFFSYFKVRCQNIR